jgi:hypothetical protein
MRQLNTTYSSWAAEIRPLLVVGVSLAPYPKRLTVGFALWASLLYHGWYGKGEASEAGERYD